MVKSNKIPEQSIKRYTFVKAIPPYVFRRDFFMSKADLFTKEEEQRLLSLINVEDWSEATNLVYEKAKPMGAKVYWKSGRIFEGGFIEEEDFMHDNWIKIYEYLMSDKTYLDAQSPFGYIIKHIQRYILRLDGNSTKSPHLLQDTRYAGSQRIPHKIRTRGKDFYETTTVSLDQMLDSTIKTECGEILVSGNFTDSKLCGEQDAEKDFYGVVSEKTYRESLLTRKKIFNMIYQQIADIKDVVDVNELSMGKEAVVFLTNAERG